MCPNQTKICVWLTQKIRKLITITSAIIISTVVVTVTTIISIYLSANIENTSLSGRSSKCRLQYEVVRKRFINPGVGVIKAISFAPLFSQIFSIAKTHVRYWILRLCGVIPVKYECDSKNLTVTFARSKILLTDKSTNGALVTLTPGMSIWCLIGKSSRLKATKPVQLFSILSFSAAAEAPPLPPSAPGFRGTLHLTQQRK